MSFTPFLIAAVAAAIATAVARRYALSRRMLDQPGERRSHQVATPRGGGISIALVMLGALAWLAGTRVLPQPFAVASAAGLLLVAGIGWWDDHRPLPASRRLAVHVLAAALLGWGCWMAGAPWPLALLVLGVAVVLVNVWNFMDGIDGLAASQAAIVAATAAMLAVPGGAAWWLAGALAAATIGFLPFNFPRARIFLGDVGSGALGFLLAIALGALLSSGAGEAAAATSVLLLLPASAFLVDATLTLARRMLRRERWWEPHVQHAYQATARRVGHVATTVGYALWSLLGASVAVWCADRGVAFSYMMTAAVLWQVAGGGCWRMLQDAGSRMNKSPTR